MSFIIRSASDMPYAEKIQFGFSATYTPQYEEIKLGGGYEYAFSNSNSYKSNIKETYELTWRPLDKGEASYLKNIISNNVIYWEPDFYSAHNTWVLEGNVTLTQIAAGKYQAVATLRSYATNYIFEESP